MKKLLLLGCILLFIFCAPKKTTVQTEGLEEVIIFGEEESESISTEPVLPQPTEEVVVTPPIEETAPPEEEVIPPPPVEETYVTPPPVEEPIIPPPISEEEEIAVVPPPPPVEEEPMMPPAIIEEPPSVIEETYVPPTVPTVPSPPPSVKPAQVIGFRVQIFASSTEKNASRVADDARSVFKHAIYVNYIAPYYKVRVGDCLTRQEAEILKNGALAKGYRGAFVVETMISP